jgi:hypothetical protein
MPATLELARKEFFKCLAEKALTFGTYTKGKGTAASKVVAASNADYNNRTSLEVSNAVVEALVGSRMAKKLPGQTLGDVFEKCVAGFLRSTFLELSHRRPGSWSVDHITTRSEQAVIGCEQYAHLGDLATFCLQHRELAASLGNDYAISPDVIITRQPEPDELIDSRGRFLSPGHAGRSPLRKSVNSLPILHACVSCKFTLRSDRSQNARSEALNLIRNRKGRTPHIVIVTAECLPSRLASLALGTGDIDCLYHIALPELIKAVNDLDLPDSKEMLETMISGRRIRDITDLPLDLAV